MGTRCGDIDPAIVLRLFELGLEAKDIDQILNKKSGLLGVSGIGSSDMRDIIAAAEEGGNQQAMRAVRMFVRRIVKYVGAYHALLGGADALVFTGGIGEGSAYIREKIVSRLEAIGLFLDASVNDVTHGVPAVITKAKSTWKAVVMPTNEELMIARQSLSVLTHEKEEGHELLKPAAG